MSAHLFLSVQWGYVDLCDYLFITPVISVCVASRWEAGQPHSSCAAVLYSTYTVVHKPALLSPVRLCLQHQSYAILGEPSG